MPALKSPRREQFAQNVAKSPKTGKSVTQCYEASGYRTTGHASEVASSRLLSAVEIKNRVDEILRPAVAKTRVTVESLIAELETTIGDARAAKQHTVVVNALGLSAKLVGLLRDKIEIGAPGAFSACESTGDLVREMLHDQTPAEALAALDALREAIEQHAGERAIVLPSRN